LLAALASALLLWACYFPLAWGWLAWVALVPLLSLVRSPARPRRIYFVAWVGGLAFFWPVIQWMRVADYRMYGTWAMLSTYCSLYFPVAVWLIRRLDRRTRVPLLVSVPVVWCGLEFLRSFLMTGFAWYYLAHSQHNFLPLIQISDLGGAYAVSFLVAAANAWLFELFCTQQWFRSFFGIPAPAPATHGSWWGQPLVLQAAVLLGLVGATLAYGFWRLGQDCITPGPRVALLQGNLDQRLRNQVRSSREAATNMVGHYRSLSRIAEARQPSLIVWPETSYSYDWPELASDQLPDCLAALAIGANGLPSSLPWLLVAWDYWHPAGVSFVQNYIRRVGPASRADVLLGLNALRVTRKGRVQSRYCSALLVHEDGSIGGRYDKMHRVPFGEFVPLRDVLPFMDRFAPYDFDYSITPGTHFTRFAAGKYRFGVLICFEDTDPYLGRQYVVHGEDGPPVDFLLNISNDGWFDGTSEHDEHLAICRFRAIESRRAVARAVNMGISAVIDSNGRVLAPETLASGEDVNIWEIITSNGSRSSLPLGNWSQFKHVPGVLMAAIPIDQRVSLYALWGDWLGWGCLAAMALGLVWSKLRRPAVF
jgi:apolipoprotein N-acyltransferase